MNITITTDLNWMTHGLCRAYDPDLWFPNVSGHSRLPKKVCAACPVLRDCRTHCLHLVQELGINQVKGVWGGLSEGDRDRFSKIEKLLAEND